MRQKNVYVPGFQRRRRAPAQLVDRGRAEPQLTRVVAALAVGERIRDPGVEPARVLTRRHRVEHRRHVGGRRVQRIARAERAGVVVDELQLLALADRRDAAVVAGRGEVAGIELEVGDVDRVREALRPRHHVDPELRVAAAVVVVLLQVAVRDVALLVELVVERVDAVVGVPRLPDDHDPHHLVPRGTGRVVGRIDPQHVPGLDLRAPVRPRVAVIARFHEIGPRLSK